MSAVASQITSLTNVYSTVYSGTDERKHQSSASLAFVMGIHRRPVNSPHKGPVARKMFPFDDVIMWLKVIFWNGQSADSSHVGGCFRYTYSHTRLVSPRVLYINHIGIKLGAASDLSRDISCINYIGVNRELAGWPHQSHIKVAPSQCRSRG